MFTSMQSETANLKLEEYYLLDCIAMWFGRRGSDIGQIRLGPLEQASCLIRGFWTTDILQG
jgi:hypothetical protein